MSRRALARTAPDPERSAAVMAALADRGVVLTLAPPEPPPRPIDRTRSARCGATDGALSPSLDPSLYVCAWQGWDPAPPAPEGELMNRWQFRVMIPATFEVAAEDCDGAVALAQGVCDGMAGVAVGLTVCRLEPRALTLASPERALSAGDLVAVDGGPTPNAQAMLTAGHLICPECGAGGDDDSDEFKFCEDIISERSCDSVFVPADEPAKILRVCDDYQDDPGYDTGRNARVVCQACACEFRLPEGVEFGFGSAPWSTVGQK